MPTAAVSIKTSSGHSSRILRRSGSSPMTKAELDYILGTMLDSHKNVSDLNITVDKPPQVEASGELVPVDIEPAIERLTPFQTETIALTIINNNRRLTEDLHKTGSCDCSY